jgi:hypothetical protein
LAEIAIEKQKGNYPYSGGSLEQPCLMWDAIKVFLNG